MKNNDILTFTDIESIYKDLYEGATRESVKTALKDINEICSKMVQANATPSVPAIVKALASKGIMISERSIYNRRQGKNPYPLLIDAWTKVLQGKKLNFNNLVKSSTEPDTGIRIAETTGLIRDEDLLKISDPVLRYQVSVLLGQMKSLKKQNSVLRELRELPVVYPDNQTSSLPKEGELNPDNKILQLDKLDTEILTNFLNGHGGKGLFFDDEGSLCSSKAIKGNSILSDPGLKAVIEKLLPPKLTEF
ncbi:hypothetical protein VH1807_contig00022-0139 [Vibrio harveyi]|uniref:gamma-mobile-trio protein GmtX n=1 Tax=Vibrio harveyi TaxID=669 RepID=UPI0010FFB949|nr:gamma-mobile-trio protein GmtX [Vibrio harveyi]GEA22192.1 hypothetical protein VH1807_contig00022-0139 [Vibrio harveyi]